LNSNINFFTTMAFVTNKTSKILHFKNYNCKLIKLKFAIGLLVLANCAFAQTEDSTLSAAGLKKLSLEDLMNVEVTSVSKRPEKLNEVASAVQVITGNDIRNAGIKTLAEALKLAANLQVAQVNSSQWAISARGFDNVLANKLLVLVDGRTVYTPMYGGVFWDVQNVMLEDVDRIEVISGPGGTLWGANAVNGVINIITKSSSKTQGLYADFAYGNTMPGQASIRSGGKLAEGLTYRVYGTGYKLASTVDSVGKDSTAGRKANDQWAMAQGGLRTDYETKKDQISLIANMYYGKPNPDGGNAVPVTTSGENAVARWKHTIGNIGDFQLQAYYDHTWRDFGNKFTEDAKTYDIEWQNRFRLGQRQTVTYGGNLRGIHHEVGDLPGFGFTPANKMLYLYSGFLQYEAMLIKDKLRFTLGAKLEHNSYTGLQYQPNVRLTYTPTKRNTIWGAVSRAVRNPSRLDREFAISIANFPFIMGTDSFKSETVMAYELGWRYQPIKKVSISVSTFYNFYNDVRSAEPGKGPLGYPYPITYGNGVKGETYGVELSANAQVTSWWNLRGGYTFLKKNLWAKEGSQDLNNATAESYDPQHQFLIQSNIQLPKHFQFGTVVRYVGELARPVAKGYTGIMPNPFVKAYTGLDLKIGWTYKFLELSVVGQNLLYGQHREFKASTPIREIQRSVYGRIACRF
ncbi:MAG: TonB-dependent receptor plug domain-containing protein, partial [Bacteroidia bacterium]